MVGIKHSVVTAEPNNPAYDVSATAWNAEHSIDAASIPMDKIQYPGIPANYIVTSVGGSPGVINGHSGAVLGTYANYALAVQGAMSDAGTAHVTIWIDPRYADADTSTITITKSHVTLYTGIHTAQGDITFATAQPAFKQVTIDSTSAAVQNVKIEGLTLNEIRFYANGNSIHNVIVNDCAFRPTDATSTHAIVFDGANTINYIEVTDCWIYDECTTGAIYFNVTTDVGCGQFYFTRLHYKAHVNNCTMWLSETASRVQQLVIFDMLDHVNIAQTGHVWFKFKDSSQDKGIRLISSSFEEHIPATIFVIDSGHTTRGQRHAIDFSHNSGTLCDTAGQNLTLITNNAIDADWLSSHMSFVRGHLNTFMGANTLGGFTVGTTGAVAHFIFDVGYVYWLGTVETNSVAMKG